MIRIANTSKVEISNIVVKFPSQTEMYGNILPGKTSEYREVKKAYSYAYIEAVIDNKKAKLQPIDYVGEKLLSNGKYTYSLSYNPNDGLRLEMENDN